MSEYSFDRFSVFIVEDNKYVGRVIEDLFRRLQFGRISTAENGQEAIEYFKTLHGKPQMASSLGLDIVVSDLVMSPINGLLLLRWLRTAKESPNRFIPFIMLSGAADREYVHAARDLGVTEFLAKPFSVAGVYKKVLEVIDYPRQFVTSSKYFGPDRRRQDMGAPKEERRHNKDADVAIVYSSEKVVKPTKPTDVWYFRLTNALKEKAGGIGAKGGGEIPAALLEEAEEQLQRAALDFTKWAANYLGELSELCNEALARPTGRRAHFEKINILAHELRGQGGTFGYPLISTVGKMLYDCTGEHCREDDNAVEIVKAHIDIMRAVIRDKVAGDGGKVGRELLKGLTLAVDKYSAVE